MNSQKLKTFLNFKVTDDALKLQTEQESVKTNVAALEAIRQQQCQPAKETFPAHIHHSVLTTNMSFNDWAAHINKLVTDKKYSYVSTFGSKSADS